MAAQGALLLVVAAQAAALERLPWMDDDGIVLAESWRSPAHRARALGQMNMMLPASEEEGFRREHSPAMMEELKALGATVVLIHYYEGFGLKTEEAGMKDARTLAGMARKAGLRVGAYIGGTLGWESLSKEVQESGAWQAATPDGQPMLENEQEPFRRVAAFLRPGYKDHLERALRQAVTEIKADMVYFDHVGLGNDSWDKFSAAQFQDYLTERGFKDTIRVKLPPAQADDPLGRAWVEFRIKSTSDHFRRLSGFVTSLNPQCAVVCGAGGVDSDSAAARGVYHPQLLAFSHAFRAETTKPGWSDNRAVTRIRSLKTGQALDNVTLLDCETPLEAAESLAFNLNSLGSVVWFENGRLLPPRACAGRLSPFAKPYWDFYRAHAEFYRGATRATDVAVVRTFETFAHGAGPKRRVVTDAEQALIESQTPFALMFDGNWNALDTHAAVLTPDESDLSAAQRKLLDDFKARGGEVIPAATLQGDPQRARERLGARLRVQVTALPSVAAEVTERRAVPQLLVHLVNYRVEQPVKNIAVTVRAGRLSRPIKAEYWNPIQPQPIPLKLTRTGNQLQVTVPQLDIYGLIVFTGAML